MSLLDVARDDAYPAEGSIIGATIGSYRIKSLIGVGGVGSVYVAEHPVIGTEVAVKVLRPEIAADPAMVERFIMEARATSRISSPHIPRYLDFGYMPNGLPYAVMEFFRGETVAARFRRTGPFSLEEVATLVKNVASAMQMAHERGIVHRDLKPDNLFLDGDVVKVLDFGIAKVVAHGDGDTIVVKKTMIGLLLGTPQYCAPEQALGREVGPAADVYALGATAFELLVGRPPFDGDIPAILGAKVCSDPPPARSFRPDVPAHVERGLARMLARLPSDRTPTMADVVKEVDTWVAPRAPVAVPSTRGRWALRLAIAAALAIGAGVALVEREALTAGPAPTVPAASIADAWDPAWAGGSAGALVAVTLAGLLLSRSLSRRGMRAWPEPINKGRAPRRIAARDAIRRLQTRPQTPKRIGPRRTPVRHHNFGALRHRVASRS